MSQSDIEKHSIHSPDVLEKSGAEAYAEPRVQRRKWWTIGGKDISFAPVDKDSVAESIDDFENRGIAGVHGSVFDDTDAKLFYAPVEKYEGRHRFDPDATWTPEEEHRLLRTVGLFSVVCEKDANDGLNVAGLEDLFACLLNVLCFAAGSRKHLASLI
jgi:hypothetical protein